MESSTVYRADGKPMARATWEQDDLFRIIPESVSTTFADDNGEFEDEEEDSETWDSPVKPLPKAPKCKSCKICGKKHWQACHKCPHSGDLAKYKTYEESPCSDCFLGVGGGLKNGHGKCFTWDETLHGSLYQPPEPIESDRSYETVLDCLRGFSALTPQEFSAYISVHYFSKTLKTTGKEMEKDFHGVFGKNKVMNLLKTAEEKLSEVSGASKILRGKILGQE